MCEPETHPTEDVHTPPHDACHTPALWHAPNSEATECEVTELVAALVRAVQPEYVVETGSANGFTTVAIGEALHRNGHGRGVSLEVDELLHDEASKRVTRAGVQDVMEVRLESSLDFTPEMEVDFALFDSLYELRVDEFLRYKKLGALKPGTIVTFHDWTSGLRGHYMDVREQVEQRLVRTGQLRCVYVPSPRGLVVGEVL